MTEPGVSPHEIAVLRVLSDGGWHTNVEIAEKADVAQRTARSYTLRLAKLGVLEQVDAFPRRLYRMVDNAVARNHEYFTRVEAAANAMAMPLDLRGC